MRPSNLSTYLFLFLGLCACRPDAGVFPDAGKEYEVVVVMNNIAWDSHSETLIREQFAAPVRCLPQTEPSFDVKYVVPEQFNDSARYARNILIVNIDAQYVNVSFKEKADKWLEDQEIIYLNVPDEQSLEAFLNDNRTILPDKFTKEEIVRKRNQLGKAYSRTVLNMTKEKFDITLYAPEDVTSFKGADDCLWFSNNASEGRTDLLIYSFPYEDRKSLSLENLISRRDSIAEIMIPGVKPGTCMATDRANINYSTTTLNGRYCAILRGLWHLHGDESITGPFVCYARINEGNNRVIITEAFVYDPVNKNRNYIRSMEAALQTVRFPDERE